MLRLGDSVDSWCGKCKFMLAHTIETMAGDKPARVNCNTCNTPHAYKPNAPGAGAGSRAPRQPELASSSGLQPAKSQTRRYQVLLKAKGMADAKTYSSKDKYSLGDVMQHPNFGYGVATAVKDATKVEVLFETGTKVLIHGR